MTLTEPGTDLASFTLENGLRVVHQRTGPAPVVGLALVVGAGFRDDLSGADGLAHLTEHLVLGDDRADHRTLPGWSTSAATRSDLTYFYTMGPREDLSAALRAEAERLRARSFPGESFRRQVDTVTDEIVRNRELNPYGRFPTEDAVSLLFGDSRDAHDGYGSRATVRAANVSDCRWFAARYYTPSNAVLGVVGDIDPDDVRSSTEEVFGVLPAGPPARERTLPGEGVLEGGDRVVSRPRAPFSGVAFASCLPDPREVSEYCASIALVATLLEAPVGVLRSALARPGTDLVSASGCCGRMRVPFEATGPDAMIVSVLSRTDPGVSQCRTVLDETLQQVANGQVELSTVSAAVDAWAARTIRELNSVETRAMRLASFEHVTGDAALLAQLPDLVRSVPLEAISAAARRVLDAPRAVVELRREEA